MAKFNKIATAFAGDEGWPGSGYSLMRAKAYQSDDGLRWKVTVHCSDGSNQGYLEAHHTLDFEGRGDDIHEAIESVRDDVESCEWLTLPERRQLLRDLKYAVEDLEEEEVE